MTDSSYEFFLLHLANNSLSPVLEFESFPDPFFHVLSYGTQEIGGFPAKQRS